MKQTPLKRSTKPLPRTPLRRAKPKPRQRSVSPASPEQREKVRDDAVSVVSGLEGCDPAHIIPRSLGGCDDALCVVPLTRTEHRAYDQGVLNLLPYLVGTHVAELQHALGHVDGALLRLVHVVTGERHVPASLSRDYGERVG